MRKVFILLLACTLLSGCAGLSRYEERSSWSSMKYRERMHKARHFENKKLREAIKRKEEKLRELARKEEKLRKLAQKENQREAEHKTKKGQRLAEHHMKKKEILHEVRHKEGQISAETSRKHNHAVSDLLSSR